MNRILLYSNGGQSYGGGPLPPVPTRADVCGVRTHFQGLIYHTQEFGDFPGWFLELLTVPDLLSALSSHKAVGDTHVVMDLVGAYEEAGVVYGDRLKAGYDFTNQLATFKARVRIPITLGFKVIVFLGGDGRSINPNPQFGEYNDPVGHTYGYEWLMNNLSRIVKALRGDSDGEAPGENLLPYILFSPGYDGVFYGWGDPPGQPDLQPARVLAYGAYLRHLDAGVYSGIEHTPGNIPVGEGAANFQGGMNTFDTLMSEFQNWPAHGDDAWQVACRYLGPCYRRPNDQPAGDDTRCPYYLGVGTPRGPYYPVAFEYAKYPESHGYTVNVDEGRAYYQSLGYSFWG